MRSPIIAIMLLAAALASAPAMAQNTAPRPADPPSASELDKGTTPEQRAALIGKPVWTSDGKEIGIVSKVLTGADGKVEAVHVSVGSFMGLGERQVRVDASLIRLLEDRLMLTVSAEEVRMLPDVEESA